MPYNPLEKERIFKSAFDSYYSKVFRLCKGYFEGNEVIAEDVTQEIFIKIWEHLNEFRNESSLSTWIYRITVNTCLMQLRKSKKIKTTELKTDFAPAVVETESETKEEQLQKMYECIQKLDETGKMITLMMLEGINYTEIALVAGVTEDALRVRIHRIKKSLTQCVQK